MCFVASCQDHRRSERGTGEKKKLAKNNKEQGNKCQNQNQVEDALEVKEVNKIGKDRPRVGKEPWKRALLRNEPRLVAQNSYLFDLFEKCALAFFR